MSSDWSNFFVAQVGASAALAGLLFVAISINIERLLKYPWLVSRAALTLLLLFGSLVEASFALWPHQTLRTTGLELLVASLIVWGTAMALSLHGRAPTEYRVSTVLDFVLWQLATLSSIGGAASILVFGSEAGLFAIASGILGALIVGFLNSWVFLVEILR